MPPDPEIKSSTVLHLSLAQAVAVCAFLFSSITGAITATWWFSGQVNEIKQSQADIRDMVKTKMWSAEDQDSFVYILGEKNPSMVWKIPYAVEVRKFEQHPQ